MTLKKRATFLHLLADGHSIKFSAEKIGYARQHMYVLRAHDELFAKDWDAALEAGTDALEDALWERAVPGTRKPIYQQGRRVGYVREYSDTAAIFLLKGRAPAKYRERFEHMGKDGGPIRMDGTIIADGTEDQYIAALREMRSERAKTHVNGDGQ